MFKHDSIVLSLILFAIVLLDTCNFTVFGECMTLEHDVDCTAFNNVDGDRCIQLAKPSKYAVIQYNMQTI